MANLGTYQGVPIEIMEDAPKYLLPEWLVPGVVKWPAGFRQEINDWANEFLGLGPSVVADGEVWETPVTVYMNIRTYNTLRQQLHGPLDA